MLTIKIPIVYVNAHKINQIEELGESRGDIITEEAAKLVVQSIILIQTK